MKKFIFNFRYALKNIVFGKLKSIAVFITFTLIFIIVYAILSTKIIMSNYYIDRFEQKYLNYNLVMAIDENTNARFFSIRHIPSEGINDKVAFLEINTLMNHSKSDYVKILAGDIANLKKINTNINFDSINEDEVIITKSLALDFDLEIGTEVSLQLDNSKKYIVKDIVKDGGLFSNKTIFIDKDSNVKNILNGLNLGSINPDLTKYLFNIVYLDVDNIDIINEIKAISEYKQLSIEPSYSEELINQNIKRATTSFLVVFVFVLVAILFVLQTILAIVFKGKVKEIGIIKSIGGNSSSFFVVILFEILIYFIISLLLGILFTNIIINYGYSLVASDLRIFLDLKIIIAGIGLVFFILLISTLLNYNQIRKTSIVSLSQDNNVRVKDDIVLPFILILGVLLIINLLFNQDIKLQAVISSLIYIFLGLFIFRLLLKFGNFSKKNNFFKIFSIKNVNQNKNIFHNSNIVIISFFSIILMFTNIKYHQNTEELLKKSLLADFLITNIYTNADDIVYDLRLMDDVDDADAGLMYQNITIENTDIVIDYLLSVTNEKIFTYFDLNIGNETIERLQDKEKPFIILSEKYKYLNDYQAGDMISLNISEVYPSEDFVIAGFFSDRNNLIAITNMVDCDMYQDVSKNSLFVNSLDKKDILYQDLINKYQSKLYYIIDFDLIISDFYNDYNSALKYLTYMSYMIVFCFAFTIFNNSILIFEELKSNYAKIKILGMRNSSLIIEVLKENIYLLICVFISVILMAIGVLPNIQNIVLYFNIYYPFIINISHLFEAISFCIIVYFISNIGYLFRLIKLNIITEI